MFNNLHKILDELFNNDEEADDRANLEKLIAILQQNDFSPLDLNQVITKGFNVGRTPLYCIMKLALEGCPGPLFVLFNWKNPDFLKKLDFTFKPVTENDYSHSIIELFIMFISSRSEKNINLTEEKIRILKQLLAHTDLSKIDFNIELDKSSEESKEVAEETKEIAEEDELLEYGISHLKLSDSIESKQDTRPHLSRRTTLLTVIATFAALTNEPELLDMIFSSVKPQSLDFNAEQDSATALWWIAKLALDSEKPLRSVFLTVPVTQLDLESKTKNEPPYLGQSVEDLLANTKWQQVICFLKHLAEARRIYQFGKKNHLDGYLKSVFSNAEKAAATGETFVFYQLAMFFLEIRDFQKFREAIDRLPRGDKLIDKAFDHLFDLANQFQCEGESQYLQSAVDAFPEDAKKHDEAIFLYVNYLMNPNELNDLSSLNPDEQKTQENLVKKAFRYALRMTDSDSQDIRKMLGVNYAYNIEETDKKKKLLPSENKHDSLLNHIKGDEQTCLLSLDLLKRHVQKEKELAAYKDQLKKCQSELDRAKMQRDQLINRGTNIKPTHKRSKSG